METRATRHFIKYYPHRTVNRRVMKDVIVLAKFIDGNEMFVETENSLEKTHIKLEIPSQEEYRQHNNPQIRHEFQITVPNTQMGAIPVSQRNRIYMAPPMNYNDLEPVVRPLKKKTICNILYITLDNSNDFSAIKESLKVKFDNTEILDTDSQDIKTKKTVAKFFNEIKIVYDSNIAIERLTEEDKELIYNYLSSVILDCNMYSTPTYINHKSCYIQREIKMPIPHLETILNDNDSINKNAFRYYMFSYLILGFSINAAMDMNVLLSSNTLDTFNNNILDVITNKYPHEEHSFRRRGNRDFINLPHPINVCSYNFKNTTNDARPLFYGSISYNYAYNTSRNLHSVLLYLENCILTGNFSKYFKLSLNLDLNGLTTSFHGYNVCANINVYMLNDIYDKIFNSKIIISLQLYNFIKYCFNRNSDETFRYIRSIQLTDDIKSLVNNLNLDDIEPAMMTRYTEIETTKLEVKPFKYQRNNVLWMSQIEDKVRRNSLVFKSILDCDLHFINGIKPFTNIINTYNNRTIFNIDEDNFTTDQIRDIKLYVNSSNAGRNDSDLVKVILYENIISKYISDIVLCGGVIADEVGLGKTLQAFSHILMSIEDDRAQRENPDIIGLNYDNNNLIIVPSRLVSQWYDEFIKYIKSQHKDYIKVCKIVSIMDIRKIEKLKHNTYDVYIISTQLFSNENYKIYLDEDASTAMSTRKLQVKKCDHEDVADVASIEKELETNVSQPEDLYNYDKAVNESLKQQQSTTPTNETINEFFILETLQSLSTTSALKLTILRMLRQYSTIELKIQVRTIIINSLELLEIELNDVIKADMIQFIMRNCPDPKVVVKKSSSSSKKNISKGTKSTKSTTKTTNLADNADNVEEEDDIAVITRTSKKVNKFNIYKTKWNRIWIDEAHEKLIISNFSLVSESRIVNNILRLQSNYKWVISATPFEKGIDNLKGITSFLNSSPINNIKLYPTNTYNNQMEHRNKLHSKIIDGMSEEEVQRMLQTVYRKNIKSAVSNEISIPLFSQEISFLTQTQIERNIYLESLRLNDIARLFKLCTHIQVSEMDEIFNSSDEILSLSDINTKLSKNFKILQLELIEKNKKIAPIITNKAWISKLLDNLEDFILKPIIKAAEDAKKRVYVNYPIERRKEMREIFTYAIISDSIRNNSYMYISLIAETIMSGINSIIVDSKTDDTLSYFNEIQSDCIDQAENLHNATSVNDKLFVLSLITNALKIHNDSELNNNQKTFENNETEIKRLENVMIQFSKTEYIKETINDPCGICFIDFEKSCAITSCRHVFCNECHQNLLSTNSNSSNISCPFCRHTLVKDSDITLVSVDSIKNANTSEHSKAITSSDEIQLTEEEILEATKKEEVNTKNINKYGSKLAYLVKYLNEIFLDVSTRVIIFSQYDRMLRLIGGVLKEHSINHIFLKGSAATLTKNIKKFKEDANIRVIMLSSETCASGSNLTEASHIIFVDVINAEKSQSRDIETQAIGRAVRLGQSKCVVVKRLIMSNTIEADYYEMNKYDIMELQ
jgi:SNF2 family DNA or RNA helicase